MTPAGNLLFAQINALPAIDKDKASNEILKLDSALSFWDEYRHIRMIPMMTKNGIAGKDGVLANSLAGDFIWAPHAPKVIVDWCEDYLFPWLGSKARLAVLITETNASNKEHFDCSPNELNTMQHKFRYVLQGKTNTLYWITDKGNVPAPDIENPFIMDGGWPHGMVNSTPETKITLALGSPWNGKYHYGNDITLLQNRNEYKMPQEIDYLWHAR